MDTQHRLLVLGSLEQFVPLVRRARKRGYYTVVCDGNPDGPAKALADAVYTIDISDTEAVADVCRREQVDGIVTGFSDFLAERAALIAKAADLPFYITPERLRYLRDKSLMKRMFNELGIPHPKSVLARRETLAQDVRGLTFPCVAKPVAGWGSHGTMLFHDADGIAAQFDSITSSVSTGSQDGILVEEYNGGFEFNLMSWVVDGKPAVLEVADREKTAYSSSELPQVTRIVYPSRLTDEVLAGAGEIVAKVASYVGLVNGPLCMQFFWSPERGIQVCECAGRIFGYEHELLEHATSGGLAVEDLLLDCAYEPDSISSRLAGHDPHLGRVAFGLYFLGREEQIASIEGLPAKDDPHVVQLSVYYEPGEVISHSVGSKPYVVMIYLVADSFEEADALTDQIFASVSVKGMDGQELLYKHERVDYSRVLPDASGE